LRVFIVFTILLVFVSVGYAQEMKTYTAEGYRIMIPSSWKPRQIQAPSGTIATLFIGSNDFGCSLESSLINKKLMPKMANSTPQQRQAFIMSEWEVEDWFTLYPNLSSSKDFQVHVNSKTTLGKELPASMLEYSWVNHEAVCCRSRTILTFTSKRQFSLTCHGFGKTAESARVGFARNLGLLQKVQYSFSEFK
jgi:hypothetical protein